MGNAFIYYIYLKAIKRNESENVAFFDTIDPQSFKINISFDFDSWYKKEQFCQITEWSIDIDNLINDLNSILEDNDKNSVINAIENHNLVKSIIKEFRY